KFIVLVEDNSFVELNENPSRAWFYVNGNIYEHLSLEKEVEIIWETETEKANSDIPFRNSEKVTILWLEGIVRMRYREKIFFGINKVDNSSVCYMNNIIHEMDYTMSIFKVIPKSINRRDSMEDVMKKFFDLYFVNLVEAYI